MTKQREQATQVVIDKLTSAVAEGANNILLTQSEYELLSEMPFSEVGEDLKIHANKKQVAAPKIAGSEFQGAQYQTVMIHIKRESSVNGGADDATA